MQTPKNVEFNVEGDILTIQVDLSQDHGVSGSGKSNTIASTYGWAPVDDDGAIININCNRKIKNGGFSYG